MTLFADGEPVMGSQPIAGRPARSGIAMATDPAAGWDATYASGEPARPSPPQRAAR